jgi:hypothetical protein
VALFAKFHQHVIWAIIGKGKKIPARNQYTTGWMENSLISLAAL